MVLLYRFALSPDATTFSTWLSSTMDNDLPFLLTPILPTSAATVNATLEQRTGFMPEPDGRGTFAVIWSCLFTWIICLWSVVQLNLPAINDPKMLWYMRKIGCFCLGAVAPELVVTIAFTQWRDARNSLDGMNKVQWQRCVPTSRTIDSCQRQEDVSTSINAVHPPPFKH